MFLIKVVYAMLCVCVFLCPSSFIVGSPSYLLSILIQNGIQANSHHQIYFDVASIVRPFSFMKRFLRRPTINDSFLALKSPSKLGSFGHSKSKFQFSIKNVHYFIKMPFRLFSSQIAIFIKIDHFRITFSKFKNV